MRRALPEPAPSARRRWPSGRRRRPAHPPDRSSSRPEPARTLQLQIFPEPSGLRTADRDLRRLLVFHSQDVVPTEPRDDLLDLVDVDQMRAVHAPEDGWIEPRLQLVERPIV